MDAEILNLEALKEIIGSSKEDMAGFYELFKEQTELDISDFRKFIAEKNMDETAKVAHKLKSSYGSIGSAAAYETLANLEKAAKEGDETGKIELLFEKYLDINGKIKKEFENYLKN